MLNLTVSACKISELYSTVFGIIMYRTSSWVTLASLGLRVPKAVDSCAFKLVVALSIQTSRFRGYVACVPCLLVVAVALPRGLYSPSIQRLGFAVRYALHCAAAAAAACVRQQPIQAFQAFRLKSLLTHAEKVRAYKTPTKSVGSAHLLLLPLPHRGPDLKWGRPCYVSIYN